MDINNDVINMEEYMIIIDTCNKSPSVTNIFIEINILFFEFEEP